MEKVCTCCVALCKDLAYLIQPDCQLLSRELARSGHRLETALWSDPSVDWTQYDLVLPLGVHDYPLHFDKFKGWLHHLETSKVKVLNSLRVLKWSMNKRYLLQLQSHGVTIAETTICKKRNTRFPRLSHLLTEKGWEEALFKPIIGTNSLGVKRIKATDNLEEAQAAFENLLRKGDVLFQEYISEMALTGEICCVFLGGVLSHTIMKKATKDAQIITKGTDILVSEITPSEDVISAAKHALDAGRKILAMDEPLLYGRVDLCDDRTNNKIVINELELVEPSLFLDTNDKAVESMANMLIQLMAEHFHKTTRVI